MKTYIFECSESDKEQIQQMLTASGLKGEMVYSPDKLSAENAGSFSDAENISVFVNSQVTADAIAKMPNLKFISTRSTGFDHVDSAAAKEKNIAVSNVPAYGSRTVAEFAFALILGLSRKAFLAYRQVKDSHNYNISSFEGFNLQGKTIGIVGTGRIGQNAAQIAKGFDMKILAFDAFPKPELATTLGFEYVPLNDLLSKSDVITLHVPYNKDTHHLINSENIKTNKTRRNFGKYFAREVAETQALLYAVENKILSGVGLDVIEGEKMLIDESHALESAHQEDIKTLLKDHLLIDRPEVVFTPHIAFFSTEAKHEILNTSVQNILAAENQQPINLIPQK